MFSHDEHEKLVADQLKNLGHNISSNGLHETPARVARYHGEHLRADGDPGEEAVKLLKEFDAPGRGIWNQIQSSFSSTCEHHLAPFFGVAQVVYLAGKSIVGCSKIHRALDVIGRRPQVQERIALEMAEAMMQFQPVGVLVDLTGRHTCMIGRGIRDPQAVTRTRVLRGVFEHDADLRAQAISMLT